MVNNLRLYALIFLVSLLVACGQAETNETVVIVTATAVSTTNTPTRIPSPTNTPTVTPTQTPSPTATATATITPTQIHSSSTTATSMPTLTPLPTIPPDQRGQIYNELSDTNGGCKLPCWWGFEMGKTSLDEIHQFYATFDAYIDQRDYQDGVSILEALFVDPLIEEGIQTNHAFVAQDGVVIEAAIHLKSQPSNQMKSILERFGQPTEVWMWSIPEPYQGILPTRYYLYFPNHGLFFLYATGGKNSGDNVRICFDDIGGTTVHMWDPKIWDPHKEKDFIDRIERSAESFIYTDYRPIEEVSNWDVEQFYNNLTDPNSTECLETPSSLWPTPW